MRHSICMLGDAYNMYLKIHFWKQDILVVKIQTRLSCVHFAGKSKRATFEIATFLWHIIGIFNYASLMDGSEPNFTDDALFFPGFERHIMTMHSVMDAYYYYRNELAAKRICAITNNTNILLC